MKDYKNPIKATMNKAKDNLLDIADSIYQQGYEAGKAATPFTDTEEAEKKAYNRGLNEAWEVAKKIVLGTSKGGYPMEVLHRIFSFSNSSDIFSIYDVTDAIARIKAYEDKQKQDAEIKVGDEIVYSDGIKGIVVGISNITGQISVLNNEYDVPQLIVKNRAKKTGRTFSQIAEVLAEMRGAENDK